MIVIDGKICYSPLPPEAYACKGQGHGIWYKDDLAKWNMVWLSLPGLDDYLIPEADLADMLVRVPPEVTGAVAACLDLDDEVFPGLRAALEKRPSEFLPHFMNGPKEVLPPYGVLGPAWVQTVKLRSWSADQVKFAETIANDSAARFVENVVYAQFGRKK